MRKTLVLLVSWFLALASSTTAIPCDTTPDMPQGIVSLRDVILSKERYVELAQLWEAYREKHPGSALATVNWLRARRYAQDTKGLKPLELLQGAVEIEPDCAEALVALGNEEFGQSLQSGKPTMQEVRGHLERAAALAPDSPTPHFLLFNIALLDHQEDRIQSELETLVHKHAFSAPLLDFGYNILVSADPQAIVLTNGDNDTYPTLALQGVFGVRPDVRIINLSLLNLSRYAKTILCGGKSASAPFTEAEVLSKQSKESHEFVDGRALVQEFMEKIARGEWKHPVYFAVTVPPSYLDPVCHQELGMEGLLYRVLPEAGSSSSEEAPLALEKTDSLLTQTFRLQSATDFDYFWTSESAVGRLMWNYFSLWYRAASAYADKGDLDGVRRMLRPAVTWLQFHPELRKTRDEDPLPKLLAYWKKLDPENPEVDQLRSQGKN